MKNIRFIFLSLLLAGNVLSGMDQPSGYAHPSVKADDPLTLPRLKTLNQSVEQLKKDLFAKNDSNAVRKLINDIKNNLREVMKFPQETYYAWHDIFEPNKATLVGNAESAARVVDLQVQQLVKRNKPVPAELQAQHANARTNIHLVKDFLYPLEKQLSFGQPNPNVEAARSK